MRLQAYRCSSAISERRRIVAQRSISPSGNRGSHSLSDPTRSCAAALLRFGSGEFLILLTLHHLIGDRSSLRLLAQELGELLRAVSERRTPAIPDARTPVFRLYPMAAFDSYGGLGAAAVLLEMAVAGDPHCPRVASRRARSATGMPSPRRGLPLHGMRSLGMRSAPSPRVNTLGRQRSR